MIPPSDANSVAPDLAGAADEVTFGNRGPVGHILLNRPAKLNSITPTIARQITAYLAAAEADPQLRAIVISGAGERAFCTGADLNVVMNGEADRLSTDQGGFAGLVRFPRTKPLIGAVHGYTLAGGFEIAMACDLLVAERSVVFALPELERGLIPNGGGLTRLPQIVPPKVAHDVILTGRQIDGEQARDLGLISRLVEPGTALDTAFEMAATIASRAPGAVEASLRIVRTVTEGAMNPVWDLSTMIASAIRTGPDARSGARAFVEGA